MKRWWPVALIVVLLVLNWVENAHIHKTALLTAAGDTTDRRVAILLAEADSLRVMVRDSGRVWTTRDSTAARETARLRRQLAHNPVVVPRPLVDSLVRGMESEIVTLRGSVDFWRRVYVASDSLLTRSQGQVADLTKQRDAWRREARPGLFSLRRIRPGVTCGLQLSGGIGCAVGLGVSL